VSAVCGTPRSILLYADTEIVARLAATLPDQAEGIEPADRLARTELD